MKRIPKRVLVAALLPLWLGGCMSGGLLGTVGPDYTPEAPPVAGRWHAATPAPAADQPVRPHQGDAADLRRWWDRFDDPVLARLLDAAQKESASVADARARIEQSRSDLVGAGVASFPDLALNISSACAGMSFGCPAQYRRRQLVSIQSNWELDLFGGHARQREATQAQFDSHMAAWHDARVAVAVEVANAYLGYRYCRIQLNLAGADVESLANSARLADIAGRAGLQAPAEVALTRASAAEGANTLSKRAADCDRAVKGLVALTGLDEAALRQELDADPARATRLPSPPAFTLDALPATVVQQRPDVNAAERDVAQASAQIGVNEAERYPKLSISGSLTANPIVFGGAQGARASRWAIGPSLSVPLVDGGRRIADVEAAKAQYGAAVVRYHATVRTAVKEVEEALVRLASADQQLPRAKDALQAYRTSFDAANTRHQAGLGSLLDAESARRALLSAEATLAELEQERVSAWIALYRAAGGSWPEPAGTPDAATVRTQRPAVAAVPSRISNSEASHD